jgi:hypothetical protein
LNVPPPPLRTFVDRGLESLEEVFPEMAWEIDVAPAEPYPKINY